LTVVVIDGIGGQSVHVFLQTKDGKKEISNKQIHEYYAHHQKKKQKGKQRRC
jgi:hypothetical protein